MLIQHIALVSEANGLSAADLAWVSAALQKQAMRDLAPVWGIHATVDAFPRLEDVPLSYWPIIISFTRLGDHAGIHLDRNGQPYAQIEATTDWPFYASRACLEMLTNPTENRTVVAPSPRSDRAPVEFLLEVCGPCAGPEQGYAVNDVIVSDFCTPEFFVSRPREGERYSFGGSVSAPLEVLPGGHLSWHDPLSDSWWLRSHWGVHAIDTQLGVLDKRAVSVRDFVRACATLRAPLGGASPLEAATARSWHMHAARLRAERLRALPAVGLHAGLETAVSLLQQRQDRQRPQSLAEAMQAAGSIPDASSASAASHRDASADEELDVSELIEDLELVHDEGLTATPQHLGAKARPKAHVRNSTIQPPFPHTSQRASQPVAHAGADSSESANHAARTPPLSAPAEITSLPPMVWTVPPKAGAAGKRARASQVALLVASALVGGLVALAWIGRVPIVRSTATGAARSLHAESVATAPSSAPIPTRAAVPAVTVPAVAQTVAAATAVAATALPSAKPRSEPEIPNPPTAAERAVTPRKAQTARPSQGAVAKERSSRDATRELPPVPAQPSSEAQRDDSIEALIETRN